MKQAMMLTPKDLMYLEDLLAQTCTLNKRLAHEVVLLKDKDLVKEVNDSIKKTIDQYQTMLKLLKGGEAYAQQ
ncbi:MAG: oxidoreductase [Erysipelotrichaceae bacterium]